MQILFISEDSQVLNFLSGLPAEAIMPMGGVELNGISENSFVTVICSGESTNYPGTIVRIDPAYSPGLDGKWMALKFIVRRSGAAMARETPFEQLPAEA